MTLAKHVRVGIVGIAMVAATVRGANLSGRVRDISKPEDAKDSGIGGLTVTVTPQGQPALPPKDTGADGTFVVDNVPNGTACTVSYSGIGYVKLPSEDHCVMPPRGDGTARDWWLWPTKTKALDAKVAAANLSLDAKGRGLTLDQEWDRLAVIPIRPSVKVTLAKECVKQDASAENSKDLVLFEYADLNSTIQIQKVLGDSILNGESVPSAAELVKSQLPSAVVADAAVWAYTSTTSTAEEKAKFTSAIKDHWDTALLSEVGARAEVVPDAKTLATDLKN